MSTTKASSHRRLILGGGIVTLALAITLGGVFYAAYHKLGQAPVGVTLSTPAPTTSQRFEAIVPASPTPQLPDTVRSILANFYAAYALQDASRLGQMFTPDTATDTTLHSVLFDGAGSGPHLFATDSVGEVTRNYTLESWAQQGNDWALELSEQRLERNQKTVMIKTLMVLTPAPVGQGTWLVASYAHPGYVGKYDGFFIH